MAYARPGIVDGAAPGFRVEEHADGAENLVLLVSKDVLAFHDLGEPAPRGFRIDSEMPREPVEISLLDDDAVVAAAVRRALGAIVLRLLFGTIVG